MRGNKRLVIGKILVLLDERRKKKDLGKEERRTKKRRELKIAKELFMRKLNIYFVYCLYLMFIRYRILT